MTEAQARDLTEWRLTARQRSDIDLLLIGTFALLTGYLSRQEYDTALTARRLTDVAVLNRRRPDLIVDTGPASA